MTRPARIKYRPDEMNHALEAQQIAKEIHEAGFGGDATIVLTVHNAEAIQSAGRLTLTGDVYVGQHLTSEAGEFYGELIRTVLIETFRNDEFEFCEQAWRVPSLESDE